MLAAGLSKTLPTLVSPVPNRRRRVNAPVRFYERDKFMNIIFDWLPQINRSLRESTETKIKNDIQESDDIKPCHTGPISVSILSSDSLEVQSKAK